MEGAEAAKGDNCRKYDIAELVTNEKNKKTILCSTDQCSSTILKPLTATLIKKTMPLPHMHAKSCSTEDILCEDLDDYWVVDDMYNFENVGFSNTVKNIRYLTCAECELGPIGWHDVNDKTAYYVSLSRVRYK